MTDTQIIAAVLKVEGHLFLCRAAMLERDDFIFRENLVEARRILLDVCIKVLFSNDTQVNIQR